MITLASIPGATVVKADLYTTGDGMAVGTVLATWRDEFVTWSVSRMSDGRWSAFWGHYFRDEKEAMDDYRNRRGE